MGQVGQRTQHQSGVSSWAILDVEKVVQDYISQQIFVDGDRMWKEFGKPCGAADHSELRPQPIDPAVPDRASIRTRGMALKLRGDANGGNRNAHRRPRRCDRPGRRRLSPSADQDRSFLRTTPAKKPRTECCCQWVALCGEMRRIKCASFGPKRTLRATCPWRNGHNLKGEQPRELRRLLVFDEAWRVKEARGCKSWRERGRAFGVGIVIGTQFPGDIPDDLSGTLATIDAEQSKRGSPALCIVEACWINVRIRCTKAAQAAICFTEAPRLL